MRVSFIRGAYLNNFEGQNFDFTNQSDISFCGYSSLFPIDSNVPFPIVRLLSIADIQKIPLLNSPVRYISNRILGDSQILWGLENHIYSSDIVHIADPHYYYSYQAAVLKKKRVVKKLISTWWETIPFNNEGTSAKKYIKQFVMNETDVFLCYTEKARDCLIQEGVDTQKIATIPLGVDLNKFNLNKNEHNEFTVLFVGRLVVEKGVLDLYEVFKKIAKANGKTVKLRLVGTGPLESKLKRLIEKDNLTKQVTVESRSYREMSEVYQQSDVLCVPSKKTSSWEEQYGMVFIEAMACGIPIVSYLTGAIPEIVKDCGFILNEGDREQMEKSLIRLRTDEKLCHKIGTMGRERAEEYFNARKTSKNIYNLYKSLAN